MDNDERAENEDVEDGDEPEALTDEQIRKNRTRAALVRAGSDMGIESTSAANSGSNSGELIPQEHGGALLPGGVPGHEGGPGRPPSEIRAACREHGYVQVENLGNLAKKQKSGELEMTVTENVRLSDVLNKYGVGTSIAYTIDEIDTIKLCITVAMEDFGIDAAEFWKAITARLA